MGSMPKMDHTRLVYILFHGKDTFVHSTEGGRKDGSGGRIW